MFKNVFYLSVIALLFSEVVSQALPCHSNKKLQASWKCEKVVLPKYLCNACPLKPVKWNGNFFNCKSIFNLSSNWCHNQLKEYVKLNPCDTKRASQVKTMLNGKNEWVKKQAKEKIDYFIYSLCEQCCDCIPKSSKNINFWQAKQQENLLYSSSRGNCAAHAHFDVS